jgi:hypothetical protein
MRPDKFTGISQGLPRTLKWHESHQEITPNLSVWDSSGKTGTSPTKIYEKPANEPVNLSAPHNRIVVANRGSLASLPHPKKPLLQAPGKW